MKLWNNYTGRRYVINNPQGKVLQHNDLVIVHPNPNSQLGFTEKFYAVIEAHYDDDNKTFVRPIELLDGNPFGKYRLDKGDIDFCSLEPVHWWTEENRTIQSPIFQTLIKMLNIPNKALIGLPGFVDDRYVDQFNFNNEEAEW